MSKFKLSHDLKLFHHFLEATYFSIKMLWHTHQRPSKFLQFYGVCSAARQLFQAAPINVSRLKCPGALLKLDQYFQTGPLKQRNALLYLKLYCQWS